MTGMITQQSVRGYIAPEAKNLQQWQEFAE